MAVLMLLMALVGVPALVGFMFAEGGHPKQRIGLFGFIRIGDRIVYRKQKASTHPAPAAQGIRAAERGDLYYYIVNKYWTVEDILTDGRIVARTRTNKLHRLTADDPNLHKAGLLERLRHRARFP